MFYYYYFENCLVSLLQWSCFLEGSCVDLNFIDWELAVLPVHVLYDLASNLFIDIIWSSLRACHIGTMRVRSVGKRGWGCLFALRMCS